MMETEALKRALSSFENFENLTSLVIDGDNKNSKVLQSKEYNLNVLRDLNHTKMSSEKYLTKELNALCFRLFLLNT